MNRNVLKIIALVTMVIDHIGAYLLKGAPIYFALRAIGRISMPIYAFFVAQGYQYTRSRKRYVLSLLFWAVISQIPYILITKAFRPNIIFTLFFATVCIYLIENFKMHKVWYSLALIAIALLATRYLSYYLCGILLILAFYFIKNKKWQFLVAVVLLVLIALRRGRFTFGKGWISLLYLCNLIPLILLYFYNGQKGKANLKYLFYGFYPAHLFILYFISLLI